MPTVTPLAVDDIDLLERRLSNGREFYPWQRRLLRRSLMVGHIPAAVDIPTGLGKTMVMALWLIARAHGAPVPRRLVYVVDRRAVVDQATNEAELLAAKLRALLEDHEIDSASRHRWRSNLGLLPSQDIAISTLRGQFIDNRKWLERPHSASIVVGTVDMIGSRLLFGGYGVSLGMRPWHAGLLASDSLIVLDEAHLVPPFEELLRSIVRFTDADRVGPAEFIPAMNVMALSATGRTQDHLSIFRLDAEDERDPATLRRLASEKKLRLLETVEVKELAKELAERAAELANGSRRVIVFCNSRKTAQQVSALLDEFVKKRFGKDEHLTELFVGERRVRERLLLYGAPGNPGSAESVFSRFLPTDSVPASSLPAFLIATSAGEVGVDLDADDLVCDLVSWERMVQRFGRVNRRQSPGTAFIEIVPSISEKDAEDEIALGRLATLKAPFESPEWRPDTDGTRDASPLALQNLKRARPLAAMIAAAETSPPLYPELTRPIVESWAMTSLRVHPGRPKIDPWIRGWIDKEPATRVVWRTRFPVRAGFDDSPATLEAAQDELQRYFAAAPPHLSEVLEAPTYRVVELLKHRLEAFGGKEGDGVMAGRSVDHRPLVVSLDDRGDVEAVLTMGTLARAKSDRLHRDIAERVLVIDARFAGLDEHGLLDVKHGEPPATIDDTIDERPWLLDLTESFQRRIRWGRYVPANERNWRKEGYRWSLSPEDENSVELWVELWRDAESTSGDAAIARKAQALDEHHDWTRREALRIAEHLGLAAAKSLVLSEAAAFHDTGKNRDLWQNAMNAARSGRPFAKTAGGAAPKALAGYRHEFGSVADATGHAPISALPEEDRDLALHLIATHHGYGRPAINAFDPNAPPRASSRLAQECASRYLRLQGTWGPWGLAWLETLVRASDWAASRKVNEDA
jgi:CRISPR-associated endonuclease/helicase Cas3